MKKLIVVIIAVVLFLGACDRVWEVPAFNSPIKPTPVPGTPTPQGCLWVWDDDDGCNPF